MKKTSLFPILMIGYCICFAQEHQISYHFPDEVVEQVEDYLSKKDDEAVFNYGRVYFKEDTVELFLNNLQISEDLDSSYVYQLIMSSNRYLQLRSQDLPLVSSTDFYFSDFTYKKLSEDRYLITSIGGSRGLYIRFVGRGPNGKVLEIEY